MFIAVRTAPLLIGFRCQGAYLIITFTDLPSGVRTM